MFFFFYYSYKCDEDTNENCTDCGDPNINHRI